MAHREIGSRRQIRRKIGSGFGVGSTADDVLRGIDLSHQVALVTGGYSGIGWETTRALARAGAHVIVPARRPSAARESLAGIEGVEVDELDLADLTRVRQFADRLLASGRRLDLLLANGGIMACPERRVGPGWEAQFAINHLGHFALVNRLWPVINPGARVISVSSAGHRFSGMRWDDVHFERGYDRWLAYGQAKTANALFAVELDALGRDSGVRAFSVHPGAIRTPIQRYLDAEEMINLGWMDSDGNALHGVFKSPAQGAATQVWAATSPHLAAMGGRYLEDCEVADIDDTEGGYSGVRGYATDTDEAERLWTLSAELTGFDAFHGRGRGAASH